MVQDRGPRGGRMPGLLRSLAARKEFSVFMALTLLCVAISFISPYFLTVKNIFNVLRQFSIIGILAVGEALIIITGGIDLSIGSLVGLSGIMTGLFVKAGVPPVPLCLLVIGCGCAFGSVNGLLVTRIGINPFIATLGMLSIARGSALLITGGLPISVENPINFLGDGHIGPVPFPVILMFVVAAVGQVFATRTLPGRNVFAVGNNERAAKLSGIRVEGTKMMVFMVMGGLCALSGIVLTGTLSSAAPTAGSGYELDVIAAVVMGGASLSGGVGSIVGVIFGAALMGVLRNGFVLMGVSAYWQVVSIGVVIIAAVSLDSLGAKRKRS